MQFTPVERRVAMAALALALAACGAGTGPVDSAGLTPAPATEVTVEHSSGQSTVEFQPRRVVVFEYAALDTLDELGVDVVGVVQDTLPAHLDKYRSDRYTNVGTLFEPDYETINALDPDLVIVGGRSVESYPDMSELFPTIDLTYGWEDPLGDMASHARVLGSIFGLEDEVESALTGLTAKADGVRSAAETSGKSGLIVMTSAGEVTAYGPGSRFGLIHDALGVPPAVADVEAATHGDAVSFEFILESNPGLLYVIDRDKAIGQEGSPAAEVLDNELVHQTTAWQNDEVHYLDGGLWYLSLGGLGSMDAMLDEIRVSVE